MKLRKSTVPRAIASVAAARITHEVQGMKNVSGALGFKAGGGGPSSKTMTSVKKAITSAKKHIVPAIGALAEISSKGTQESSPHGKALQASVPEVQSRAEPCGQSLEPRARSPMASVPESNPEASLHVVAPLGAGRVSTGWLRLLAFIHVAL
jgi:hypothetical protein